MALSKRESILQDLTTVAQGLPWVRTVVRRQPADPGSLKAYAQTQFPVLAVAGGLPTVVRERRAGLGREYRSELPVTLTVYAMELATPDADVSSMASGLWTAMLADPTRGGAALNCEPLPYLGHEVTPPYVVFGFKLRVTYLHDHTSI